ncbi:MAG: hypothetical protein JW913_12625 [Chitinispirillaceae bacterium]|nr:hypothetical protein [Chitinispirillaceae bacterium]
MKRVAIGLCFFLGLNLSNLSAGQKAPMPSCAKIDCSGIVVSVIFYPDSVSRWTRSSYYEVTLSDAAISWSSSSDTMCLQNVQTGEYESYILSLSPYDEVTVIRPGDTLVVKGFKARGDEFGQTYSYDNLVIQNGTAVKDVHRVQRKNCNTACRSMVNLPGSDRSSFHDADNSGYYSITGRKMSAGVLRRQRAGVIIIDIK